MSKVAARIQDPWSFWMPSIEEARAVKAVAVGEATSEQQKVAVSWILQRACGLSLDTFVPGQSDTSAVRQGRRQAGLLIQQVLFTKADHWRKQGDTDV